MKAVGSSRNLRGNTSGKSSTEAEEQYSLDSHQEPRDSTSLEDKELEDGAQAFTNQDDMITNQKLNVLFNADDKEFRDTLSSNSGYEFGEKDTKDKELVKPTIQTKRQVAPNLRKVMDKFNKINDNLDTIKEIQSSGAVSEGSSLPSSPSKSRRRRSELCEPHPAYLIVPEGLKQMGADFYEYTPDIEMSHKPDDQPTNYSLHLAPVARIFHQNLLKKAQQDLSPFSSPSNVTSDDYGSKKVDPAIEVETQAAGFSKDVSELKGTTHLNDQILLQITDPKAAKMRKRLDDGLSPVMVAEDPVLDRDEGHISMSPVAKDMREKFSYGKNYKETIEQNNDSLRSDKKLPGTDIAKRIAESEIEQFQVVGDIGWQTAAKVPAAKTGERVSLGLGSLFQRK